MEDLITAIVSIIGLAFMVCLFLAWKTIFTKLEDTNPGASAVIMFIPGVNIIVIFLTALRLKREEKKERTLTI